MAATLDVNGRRYVFDGRWIEGRPWARFGLYNSYVIVRSDGRVLKMPAHAGELVPGSTEDLVATLRKLQPQSAGPPAPMTLEIDPTLRCMSHDCGGHCFSAAYRARSRSATMPSRLMREIICAFAANGGRVVRFDGGGDPLLHQDVLSGELPEFAAENDLKTTILTSGDLLYRADAQRIAASGCYVRVSLNAATDITRRRFHGNNVPLTRILASIARLAEIQARLRSEVPVGATFLLAPTNYREVLECARLARDAGVQHFSVRRILGPSSLRPKFSIEQRDELVQFLGEVRSLHSENFRVAVPWRPVDEPDPDPSAGDFSAARCWQSTIKTVVEPDPDRQGARGQLCGRYRGGGLGQRVALPTLFQVEAGQAWLPAWQRSFVDYPIARTSLLRRCVSCIDRGFILMVDRLLGFLGDRRDGFQILHLDSPEPHEARVCDGTASL